MIRYLDELSRIQKFTDPIVITFLFKLFVNEDKFILNIYTLPVWLVVLTVCYLFLPFNNLYKSYGQIRIKKIINNLNKTWISTFLVLILITFLAKNTAIYSRISISLWFISSYIYLIINHVFLRVIIRYLRSTDKIHKNIIFIGDFNSAKKVQDELNKNKWMGLKLKKWFSTSDPIKVSNEVLFSIYKGDFLSNFINSDTQDIDRIIFSSSDNYLDNYHFQEIISKLGDTSIPVFLYPEWSYENMNLNIEYLGNKQIISLWGETQSATGKNIKRIFDLFFATILLLTFLPLFLLISILIKFTSKGPIIFKQERYGERNKIFNIYKFRSMYHINSKKTKLKQVVKNDKRITKIGKFLRQWSLDELPQLVNVIKGDMSLVGPRPHASIHNEIYRKTIPGYMQRHSLLPGITGLAQIEGYRGNTENINDMKNRLEADMRYQREWSLALDIKILLKTILFLKSDKAY